MRSAWRRNLNEFVLYFQGSADSNYSQPSSDLSLDEEKESLRREKERQALNQLEKARVSHWSFACSSFTSLSLSLSLSLTFSFLLSPPPEFVFPQAFRKSFRIDRTTFHRLCSFCVPCPRRMRSVSMNKRACLMRFHRGGRNRINARSFVFRQWMRYIAGPSVILLPSNYRPSLPFIIDRVRTRRGRQLSDRCFEASVASFSSFLAPCYVHDWPIVSHLLVDELLG